MPRHPRRPPQAQVACPGRCRDVSADGATELPRLPRARRVADGRPCRCHPAGPDGSIRAGAARSRTISSRSLCGGGTAIPPAALGAGKPHRASQGQGAGHEHVQPQSRGSTLRSRSGSTPQDAVLRIARHIQGEQTRRGDLPVMPEPDKESRQRAVPDQLVQEGRLECCVGRVAGRPVSERDPQPPGQVRGAAEQFLVEVVPDLPDPRATSRAGATASMNAATLPPCLRTRHAPTGAATAIAPQIPSPPSQTAKTPYQTCGMSIGVVMSK